MVIKFSRFLSIVKFDTVTGAGRVTVHQEVNPARVHVKGWISLQRYSRRPTGPHIWIYRWLEGKTVRHVVLQHGEPRARHRAAGKGINISNLSLQASDFYWANFSHCESFYIPKTYEETFYSNCFIEFTNTINIIGRCRWELLPRIISIVYWAFLPGHVASPRQSSLARPRYSAAHRPLATGQITFHNSYTRRLLDLFITFVRFI